MNASRVARLGLFGILLGSVLVGVVPRAAVQAASVSPLRLELAGDPGQEVRSGFKVYNDDAKAQTYYIVTQNFETKDETGTPSFVAGRDGLAGWISGPSTVVVPPRAEVTVPFTVTVPSVVEPGGYFAAIFASSIPPKENGAIDIGLGYRLGTLILFRVNGDIPEGVAIPDFATVGNKRLLTQLPITFFYRFQNSGNDRVKPMGEVVIKNTIGRNSKILTANYAEGSVLPKSIRRFEATWLNSGWGGLKEDPTTEPAAAPEGFWPTVLYQARHFAFGFYTAELNLRYGVNNSSAVAAYKFFVFPWQLLLVVVGVLLILALVFWIFIRNYNRAIIRRSQR